VVKGTTINLCITSASNFTGFVTPGPNYRPNSSYWGRGFKKSFGDNVKPQGDHKGPGKIASTSSNRS